MTAKQMRAIATDLDTSAESLRRAANRWRREADEQEARERREADGVSVLAVVLATAGAMGTRRGRA